MPDRSKQGERSLLITLSPSEYEFVERMSVGMEMSESDVIKRAIDVMFVSFVALMGSREGDSQIVFTLKP